MDIALYISDHEHIGMYASSLTFNANVAELQELFVHNLHIKNNLFFSGDPYQWRSFLGVILTCDWVF